MKRETSNSRLINANSAKIFSALSNPDLILKWQAPEDMVGKIHYFNFEVGGSYSMSLFYSNNEMVGKTQANEDRFTSKFITIETDRKIVQSIQFDTENTESANEMLMEINLEPKGDQTLVTFNFKNLPQEIDPKDNEAGTESSLEKLAKLVESGID